MGAGLAPQRAIAVLFRLGCLLAGPRAGEPRKPAAGAVVEEACDDAGDRPLRGERDRELQVAHLAVLGVGRLLLVDEAPEPLEELLAEHPGEQASGDAERQEDDLHRSLTPRSRRPGAAPPRR